MGRRWAIYNHFTDKDALVAREAQRRTPSPSFNEVILRVQQEIDAGRFRVRDAQQLILMMWAVAHGLVALHFTGRFSHDANAFRQIYDNAIAMLLAHLTTG